MIKNRKSKFPKDVEVSALLRYEKDVTYNTILVWRIPAFLKLQRGVMYAQLHESENVKCVFRLFKQKETLHMSITSADLFKDTAAEFSILDSWDCKAVSLKAEQIKDGVFVGKIAYNSLVFRKILTEGTLTVAFKYVSDYFTAYRDIRPHQVYLGHWDDLCYDLKNMYLDAIFPDIHIHVREYTFMAHRFVLDARSLYFHNIFFDDDEDEKEIEEVTLDEAILPGILHQVFLYFYSGELMEMNEKCMVHVFNTAVYLESRALMKRCVKYFKEKVNQGNIQNLFGLAEQLKFEDLKKILVKAAKEIFPDFNGPDAIQTDETAIKPGKEFGEK